MLLFFSSQFVGLILSLKLVFFWREVGGGYRPQKLQIAQLEDEVANESEDKLLMCELKKHIV